MNLRIHRSSSQEDARKTQGSAVEDGACGFGILRKCRSRPSDRRGFRLIPIDPQGLFVYHCNSTEYDRRVPTAGVVAVPLRRRHAQCNTNLRSWRLCLKRR